MFNCQNCRKTSRACEPMTKVVTERRRVDYVNIVPRVSLKYDREGKPKRVFEGGAERRGRGFRIVKEINCCTQCAPIVRARVAKEEADRELINSIAPNPSLPAQHAIWESVPASL